MLETINTYAPSISALANILMIMIWGVYLHLLLDSIRRQRRSSLIISATLSRDKETECFVSNMSEGRFHIQTITVTLEPDVAPQVIDVTEPVATDHEETFQAPLAAGESLSLGSFADIIARAAEADNAGERDSDSLPSRADITVVGIHGAGRRAVGAQRRFSLHRDNGAIRARTISSETLQYRSGRDRRQLIETHQAIS